MIETNILPFDGEVYYYPSALAEDETVGQFSALLDEVDWRQEMVTVMGRRLSAPRLIAWYGRTEYVYSGVRHAPRAMPPTVEKLKRLAETVASHKFDGVLLNLYRNGADSMGWHSDNEGILGPNPVIASLSLGETRKFQLKHRATKERRDLELGDGSILIMKGETQRFWLHQVPKTRSPKRARINLTFRQMMG